MKNDAVPPDASPPGNAAPDAAPNAASTRAKPTDGVTPMMAQFLEIKEAHPGALLFYRMGDFYELFFEDAVQAAAALDIALTSRGKHLGENIPMCGVPVHSHHSYLTRLIRQGFKVAVAEQMEDPADAKKRGAKAVVKRGVKRVFTPGTLTEDTLLDSRRHNYLCALCEAQGELALAWIDVSTGVFLTQAADPASLNAALARIEPGELLAPDRFLNDGHPLKPALLEWDAALSPVPAARFDSENGKRRLKSLFKVGSLEGFGAFSRAEMAAAGALVDYVALTQKGKLPRLSRPHQVSRKAVMGIDAATRRNLELTRAMSGDRKGSLLSVIDRTVTGAGARALAERLSAPLTDIGAIDERLSDVTLFYNNSELSDNIKALLKECPDMERALSRLTLDRGGPRDLTAIGNGLTAAAAISTQLTAHDPPGGLARNAADLLGFEELTTLLSHALNDDPPLLARDGGFIRAGHAPELDELRTLRDESRRLIATLQSGYQDRTGTISLKIKHNNVLGYFIEVPAKQADRIPLNDENSPFIHRQTVKNAVRFSTVELSELESRIAKAADRAAALEMEIFDQLRAAVTDEAGRIGAAAGALAAIDVARGLAELARDYDYCRPKLTADRRFRIEQGRHPVVEAALKTEKEAFVANDCDLTDGGAAGRLWLLTGPNMAGKSTFLRQNALIAILAQIGAYVPAAAAEIGVVDQLFSRVGAADDLARGRSTFMVEMMETAAILNQAGPKALVILDEIGRGTATYDGLSIAWAVVEHLHDRNACRCLFATHYHELTALRGRLDGLECHTMRVKEWEGDVVFLHEVGAGAADRSYGIHVGGLAGLPGEVITRAGEVLRRLEEGEQSSAVTKLADDLPLFAAMADRPAGAPGRTRAEPSAVEEELRNMNPDDLTPRQALEALYRLRGLIAD